MTRMHKIRIVAICLPCLALTGFARVPIVDNNRALAIVVIADNASVTAQHAAGELTEHIRAAAGAMLPIVTESNAPENDHSRIYIGDTRAARRNGVNPDDMAPDTYILRVIDQDLYILGKERPLPDEPFDFIRHQSHPNGTLFCKATCEICTPLWLFGL